MVSNLRKMVLISAKVFVLLVFNVVWTFLIVKVSAHNGTHCWRPKHPLKISAYTAKCAKCAFVVFVGYAHDDQPNFITKSTETKSYARRVQSRIGLFRICLNCLFSRTKRAEKSKTCLDACHEENCAHKKARKHIYMSTTSMVSHERVVGALS